MDQPLLGDGSLRAPLVIFHENVTTAAENHIFDINYYFAIAQCTQVHLSILMQNVHSQSMCVVNALSLDHLLENSKHLRCNTCGIKEKVEEGSGSKHIENIW